MIDGNYWPISGDKLFDGAPIAIKNSYRLLKEAKHCFANQQHATSLSLTTLALEEFGKHLMITDAAQTNKTISKNIWKNEFERHEKKLLKIPSYLRKFSTCETKEQAKTFAKMEKLLKKLALKKLEALYVDWNGSNNSWYYYDDIPMTEKKANAKEALELAVWAIEGYVRDTNLGKLIFKTTKEIMTLFDKRQVHAFCSNCGLVMLTKPELIVHRSVKPSHKIGFQEN